MIGRNELPNDPAVYSTEEEMENPLRVFTGNGLVTVRTELPIDSEALGEEVRPMLMDSSPAALGTGYRCLKQGCGFYWPPGQSPIMITAAGRIIRHDIIDYLPYVQEPTSHSVCTSPGFGWETGLPASGSGGDADPAAADPETPAAKSGEKKWARTDMNANRFRATKTGGPDWNLVTRRLTTDSDTGELSKTSS